MRSQNNKVEIGCGGYSGMSFLSLLALLFIGLKLTGYIQWDWIWVLSPLWIPLSIILAILLIAVVIVVLYFVVGIVIGFLEVGRKK